MTFDVKAFFQSRIEQREDFLRGHIAGDFAIEPIGEDWASRHYLRIRRSDGPTLVLLESVPDHIPTATLGHKLSAFIKMATLLHDRGIHVPEIYAADEQEGWVLLEDLGDTSVHSALTQGGDQGALYGAATDVLISMRDNINENDLCGMPRYRDSYIRKGRQRIVDWYVPATRGAKNSDDLLPSYLRAWDEVAANLPPPLIGFIHGDYHPQNLMIQPDGSCGVLDFQDAMAGPLPYDLANLLENIRLDIPRDVYDGMLARYGGDEVFRAWFRVMATQFHCRIAGQIIRLAVLSNKTALLQYMPRVQNYLREGLKDPVLKPLAAWFDDEKIDLNAEGRFDPDKVRPFIREDAF